MNGLESLAAAASILGEFDGNRKVTTVLHQNVKKTISSESMGDQQEQLPKRKKYTRISPPQTKSLVNSIASSEATINEDFFLREKIAQDNCIRGDPKIRRLSNYLSQPGRVWSTHEWFYCTLDRDYCNENEFKGCLQILNIDEVHSLTRTEWSAVRGVMSSCIGRPRRFSTSFLEGERQKLNEYRKKSRNVQRGMDFPDAREFPYQVFAPIKVGDTVTVHDHSSHMIRRGQVLTIKPTTSTGEPLYRVQFPKAEVSSALCCDLDLAVHGSPEIILCRRRPGDTEDMMVVAQPAVPDESLGGGDSYSYPLHLPLSLPSLPGDMDEETHCQIRNIALLTQMLDRKERFVSALRSINQFTEEALHRKTLSAIPTISTSTSTSPPTATSSANNNVHTPNIEPIKMEYVLDSACKRKAAFAPPFKKQCAWVVTNICAADIAVETSLRHVRDAVIAQAYQEAKKSEPPSSSSVEVTPPLLSNSSTTVKSAAPASTFNKSQGEGEGGEAMEMTAGLEIMEGVAKDERDTKGGLEGEGDKEAGETQAIEKVLQEWQALLPKAKYKIKSCLEAQQTKNNHWMESTPPANSKKGNHSSSSRVANHSSDQAHRPISGAAGTKRSLSTANGIPAAHDNNNGIQNCSSSNNYMFGLVDENELLSVELIEHCVAFLLLVRRLQKKSSDFDVHTLLQPHLVGKILPFTNSEGICSSHLIALLQRLIY